MRRRCAFTLIELLVVVAIMSLLFSLLLPALSLAKKMAKTTKCLSNMRNLEVAHWMYLTANDGRLIQAGLAHGGAHAREDIAWINTLETYYGGALITRCPEDNSPHWPGGTPLSSSGQYRRCSYGINEFTDVDLCPWGGPYYNISRVDRPSSTVHFLEMAEQGDFAGADHPHVDLWVGNILAKASSQLEINQHGGDPMSWTAKANYGFLDGHAETLTFQEVFSSRTSNKFDPAIAR